MKDYEYLLSSLEKVKGIGKKTLELYCQKKIDCYDIKKSTFKQIL